MNTDAQTRPTFRRDGWLRSGRSALLWHPLLRTENSIAPTISRVALAAVIFAHGAQHLTGWFGGYGFAGTHDWMTGDVGIPAAVATLAILTEFFAPLALLVGLAGRIAALAIAGFMVGAASTHLEHGFFMNWDGAMAAGAEGFEFHILAIALALSVVIQGSGAVSADRKIMNRH